MKTSIKDDKLKLREREREVAHRKWDEPKKRKRYGRTHRNWDAFQFQLFMELSLAVGAATENLLQYFLMHTIYKLLYL